MGYHASGFAFLAEIVRRGDLKPGARILEIGSQTVSLKDHDHPHSLLQFFDSLGLPLPTDKDLLAWHDVHAKKIYEKGGFDYTSVDVNGEGGSGIFDLNFDSVPTEQIGAFDLVQNQGTIEHTLNVANGFRCVHDWTKAGGLMVHHMPFMPYVDHGFMNFQPNLYRALAAHNDYEILGMWINLDRGRLHFIPWEPRAVAAINLNTANINLAVLMRKNSDKPFNIPVQGTYAADLTDTAHMKYGYTIDGTIVMGKRGMVENYRGETDALKTSLLHRLSMKVLAGELIARLRKRIGA